MRSPLILVGFLAAFHHALASPAKTTKLSSTAASTMTAKGASSHAAPSHAAPSHASYAPRNYTAIGDSYAAGDGAYPMVAGDTDAKCLRTTSSFPDQFVKSFKGQLQNFNFPACSGADTNHVKDSQINSSSVSKSYPEVSFDFGTPNLVSIVAGGDNGDAFAHVITYCVGAITKYAPNGFPMLCNFALDQAQKTISTLKPQLQSLYLDAQRRNFIPGQNRKVFVLGYPRLYNINVDHAKCNASEAAAGDFFVPTFGNDGVANKINNLVLSLNDVIKAAAKTVGVTYVGVDEAFEGHRICDQPESGVSFQASYKDYQNVPDYTPFHPTTAGSAMMAQAFADAVSSTK